MLLSRVFFMARTMALARVSRSQERPDVADQMLEELDGVQAVE